MQQKNVHWFPGHMVKAMREIEARLNVIDIIIEIVDARCPLSSKNPFLEKLTANKKRLIVSGGTSILNFTWKDKRNVSELFNYRKINIDNAVPNIYIEITTVDNDKKIIILNSRKI